MRKGTWIIFVLVTVAVSVLMLASAGDLTAQDNTSPLPTGIGGPCLVPSATITPTLQADINMQAPRRYNSYLPLVSSGNEQ